jgi:hypothetical protein
LLSFKWHRKGGKLCGREFMVLEKAFIDVCENNRVCHIDGIFLVHNMLVQEAREAKTTQLRFLCAKSL